MSESGESNRAAAAARVLGDVLTAHHKERSSWTALVEVKVETALLGEELMSNHGSGYVVAIVCAILAGVLTVIALLLLLLWRLKKRWAIIRDSVRCGGDSVLEKSNNLQNEENLRRQLSQMKTLNVVELARCDQMHRSDCAFRSKVAEKEETDVQDHTSKATACAIYRPEESYSAENCDSIESSPMYKASCVDVRNNITGFKVASKDVNLKVLPLQRVSLRACSDTPIKCKEVIV